MKTILSLAVLFFFSIVNGQELSDQRNLNTDSVEVIVLKLSGSTEILSSSSNNLMMESTMTPKGKVYGWSDEERPPFAFDQYYSGDTLFVSSPTSRNQKIIGIDLYVEEINSEMYRPESSPRFGSEAGASKEKARRINALQANYFQHPYQRLEEHPAWWCSP